MQADRCRLCDASCVDRLIVKLHIDNSHARLSKPDRWQVDRPGQPCWPARPRNRREDRYEIDSKSMPEVAPGHPNSTLNRSRHPLGTHCVAQQRSRSVSGASPARGGRARRPPRAPWDARTSSAQERPDARRGDHNRRKAASGSDGVEFFPVRLVRAP